jgi:hypothetical protein
MPELLEQFMQEQGGDERWVTVQELRDRFSLSRYQCNTVSGFLRRLHVGTFGRFPYIVARIEPMERMTRSEPLKCRYLVKRKIPLVTGIPGMIHRVHAGVTQTAAADLSLELPGGD